MARKDSHTANALGQVFQTEQLTVALLDRTTHNAHVLEMNGESYRLNPARQRTQRARKAGKRVERVMAILCEAGSRRWSPCVPARNTHSGDAIP